MRFKKIVVVGIDEPKLLPIYWKKIDTLAGERVNLPREGIEIKKQLADADCLLTGFGITIDRELLDVAPKLRYIGIFATAYGKVDVAHAKTKSIIVCNIPGYSTESVAEFVIAAILENIRQLEEGKRQARIGNYSGAGFSAIELKDKVFGILGLGNIGSRVAEIASGFGANVRYWSRVRKSEFERKGIKYEDADTLLRMCDFLSINFAQTPDTENFLNAERIKTLKKGAIVINTAPMELVDTHALKERLQKGEITFILDHSDEMNPEEVKSLSQYKHCIIYPSIACVSKEAGTARQKIFIGNIENFLKGSPINIVR